jgi:hypothetical protein
MSHFLDRMALISEEKASLALGVVATRFTKKIAAIAPLGVEYRNRSAIWVAPTNAS